MSYLKLGWNFCTYEFGEPLTVEQIDRVRWHIFPKLRPSEQLKLFGEDEPETEMVIPDLIKIMDLQQEQLACSLGDGHRIIHGVAGSGKTLLLAYRCQRLLEEVRKPSLVLCFNVPLAARLRQMLHARGISDRQVTAQHLHQQKNQEDAPVLQQLSSIVLIKSICQLCSRCVKRSYPQESPLTSHAPQTG